VQEEEKLNEDVEDVDGSEGTYYGPCRNLGRR
jgi:hypothetical protein